MERYRPYPDLTDCPPPTDTAEIIETELSITRAERHAAVLARLTEIGMELAEALLVQAKEAPAADLAVAYAKIAQTVRRTIALEAHLEKGLTDRKESLRAQRWKRQVEVESKHDSQRRSALLDGMSGAVAERFPDDDDEVHFARLADAERLLEEDDELDGYLDQPIGEVIARLCQALGLDPDWAVERDGEWFVKQPDFVPDFACDWPDAPLRGPRVPASEDADPAPA